MREERWLIFIVQCITSTQRNENHILHTFMCGSLLPKQLMRRSPAMKFCWSWSLLCMESGSCAEDEHDWQRCPSVVYPESSAPATAVPATGKETESRPRNKEGLLQPLERENKRDRYLNCVCVCAEAPTSIKRLNVWHLKCLNFLQYVMKMSN